MKKITGFIMGFLILIFFSCSNSFAPQDVTAALTSGLLTAFPDATAIEQEENGANFEAEFVLNQIPHEALLNAAGEILMHKHEVAETEFPAPVMATINEKYSGMNKDEFYKLFIAGTDYYLVEVDEINKVFSEDGQEQTNVPEWD